MWEAATTAEFDKRFQELSSPARIEVAAAVEVLRVVGPSLGRPLVDTLKGSKHANMKELRVKVRGQVLRIAFAFDPQQRALLLTAGAKQGKNEQRFYRDLIRRADALYDEHLKRLKRKRKGA